MPPGAQTLHALGSNAFGVVVIAALALAACGDGREEVTTAVAVDP
jgi:hypothetical protein